MPTLEDRQVEHAAAAAHAQHPVGRRLLDVIGEPVDDARLLGRAPLVEHVALEKARVGERLERVDLGEGEVELGEDRFGLPVLGSDRVRCSRANHEGTVGANDSPSQHCAHFPRERRGPPA